MKKVLFPIILVLLFFGTSMIVSANNDVKKDVPDEVYSCAESELLIHKSFERELGLDPDSLRLGEPFPINMYYYSDHSDFGFNDKCGWYFPVRDSEGKTVMSVELFPNGDRYMPVTGGSDGSLETAIELYGSLLKEAGSDGDVLVMKHRNTYAVYCPKNGSLSVKGEEHIICLPGLRLDDSYKSVTDYRQLPVLADLNSEIQKEIDLAKEAGGDLWGGGSINLLPDLSKTFSPVIADPEPKIPTFVLPAALGVLACAAVAGAVYSVKKQKKKAG